MAFPVVQSRATSGQDTNSAGAHTVTMPSGITAGDLLITIFACDGASRVLTPTAGWTQLVTPTNAGTATGTIFWKVAAGSDTLAVTPDASEQSAHITLRISGAGTPEASTVAATTSNNTDPPSFTPSGGAQDYLWIATRVANSTTVATAAPASYSNLQTRAGFDASGASANTAERSLNAATEDPGGFTSGLQATVAWTLAIPPVGGAVTATAAASLGGLTGSASATVDHTATAAAPLGGLTATAEVVPPGGFPVVLATSTGSQNTDATTHSVNLPSGVTAGDLLLVVFASDGGPTLSTGSTGWVILDQDNDGTAAATGAILYKVATGSDALSVTTSVAERTAWIVYRISGARTPLPAPALAVGSTADTNPPLLSLGGADEDILWFATRSGDTNTQATVAPTSYTNLLTADSGTTSACSVAAAHRSRNNNSENPGAFTSGSQDWVSYTVAVQPATAGTVNATADAPLGALTATASADITVPATAAATLGVLTASATAVPVHPTTASATLGALTAAAVADALTHPGVASAPLGGLAAAATADAILHPAAAAAPLGALTATAAAVVTHPATASAPLGTLAATATATRSTDATASADLGSLSATATADGAASATAAATLGGLAATVTAEIAHAAAATAPLGPLTSTAAGVVTLTGTAAANLGGLDAVLGATVEHDAVAHADLERLTAQAAATTIVLAAATATLGALTATASAASVRDAVAHADLGALSATGEAEITDRPATPPTRSPIAGQLDFGTKPRAGTITTTSSIRAGTPVFT